MCLYCTFSVHKASIKRVLRRITTIYEWKKLVRDGRSRTSEGQEKGIRRVEPARKRFDGLYYPDLEHRD